MTAITRSRSTHQPARHRRQGEVLWVPAGSTWLNRDKPRPFALAATCEDPAPATLAYGSTQRTEFHAGVASVAVPAIRAGLNRNGLYATTYFYPAVLAVIDAGALPAVAGFLGKSLPAFRTALGAALGIGRKSCLSPASPEGSRRGRIVVLTPLAARQLGTAVAVVLTEPEYSREKRYQVIAPILHRSSGRLERQGVRVSGRSWLSIFDEPVESALILTSLTLSIWHVQAIARETRYVVDEDTLTEIDRRLCDYFSLPAVGDER